MSQVLFDSIMHAHGHSGPVGDGARTWNRSGTLRVRARSRPGLSPPAVAPTVFLDVSADGGATWEELVSGIVGDEVVAADATLPTGADLRVRWEFEQQASRRAWLRVWLP